ncbi:hypothetical protein NOI24_03570 [Neorhizobium galegae]|uniref:hypothetical protein n=1 Tax=Neorhizobium galegae TaxID=399 RepID=UPI0021084652|nr:hypothetical protein [Neorhizobium galegae]MCQ1770364.1 hypothetical protein [Neorhizobium galegae]MCQ1799685.1 hypothetical protein [Neorhizobium galegae]
MNDDITLTSASPANFLDRLGLPHAARERVIAIDRTLAADLASDAPDAEGCAALVIEAADLVGNAALLAFDWSGWGNDDDVDGVDDFDFEGVEWCKE